LQVHQRNDLKWTEGIGLDPASPKYQAYLKDFGKTYLRVVGDSIEKAGKAKKQRALDPVASEVMAHTKMCHRKSQTFVGQERALGRLAEFAAGGEQQPPVFILHGYCLHRTWACVRRARLACWGVPHH
jgi:hypothetical protein